MDFLYLNLEYLYTLIYWYLTNEGEGTISTLAPPRELVMFWDLFKVVSVVVSLLFLTGIIYSAIRLSQIRKEEREGYYTVATKAKDKKEVTARRDKRWDKVLEHVNSDNPSNWRLAIIEADAILDDIITRAGYHGDTLGERLKGIEKSDFNTLSEAWEAHIVRNKIAHQGSNFQFNKREALRVVGLYQTVFEEFFYI